MVFCVIGSEGNTFKPTGKAEDHDAGCISSAGVNSSPSMWPGMTEAGLVAVV